MSMNMCEVSVTMIHLKIERFLIKKREGGNKREEKKKEEENKTLEESGHLYLPVFWVLK